MGKTSQTVQNFAAFLTANEDCTRGDFDELTTSASREIGVAGN